MPTCFVAMGFGKKTDFQTGRVLDLDKTYRYIIKPAAEAAGLDCIRADEIKHSGTIDLPMYEQLLNADVVVVDLSTSNLNAAYELGVRHALRPHTTIIMAESQFKYPFDFSHIVLTSYRHQGDGIDFDEVTTMRAKLRDAIVKSLSHPAVDSPVYECIAKLKAPVLGDGGSDSNVTHVIEKIERETTIANERSSTGNLKDQIDRAMKDYDWDTARTLLIQARSLEVTEDPYLVQQLAIATYKTGNPTPQDAIEEARTLLAALNPGTLNDPEVLAVWGAVHKRRWEVAGDRSSLDTAIRAYQKAFQLRGDYANGIAVAFLLNARASLSEPVEAITDFTLAQRMRREVVELCQKMLDWAKDPQHRLEDEYGVRAALAEAWFGLGEDLKYQAEIRRAFALAPPALREAALERIAQLRTLTDLSPLEYLSRSQRR